MTVPSLPIPEPKPLAELVSLQGKRAGVTVAAADPARPWSTGSPKPGPPSRSPDVAPRH